MIAFLRDQVFPGPKMLDIEITNTFPLIPLEDEVHLLRPGKEVEILRGYDHIAIPSDFRLHISSKSDHIFFDATSLWNLVDNDRDGYIHYFTIVGLPASKAKDLVPAGKTKTWHEAMMVSPFKDKDFNDNTRLFVDFFLHNLPLNPDDMAKHPFAIDGMRLATDQHGSIIGPHSFASLQRKKKPLKDVAFSIRFGYINLETNKEITYIYAPLDIFQRRARS